MYKLFTHQMTLHLISIWFQTKRKPRPVMHIINPVVTPVIMSSFLEDFKSLIIPLLSLLTKVISSLRDKKND